MKGGGYQSGKDLRTQGERINGIGGRKIKGGISEPTTNISGRETKGIMGQIKAIIGLIINEIHAAVVTVDDFTAWNFSFCEDCCRVVVGN
jgi:hypothetical protein